MDYEMEQDYEQEQPSYWNSVIIGALIVALVTSVVGLILMYYIAGAEPSMLLMIISGLFIPITCLVGLIGGIISTRHYAKTFDLTFPIGKGALIGLFTGILAAVFAVVINQLWMVIDPTLMDNFTNNMISALEQIDMPEAQREASIDNMVENMERQNTFGGILMGLGINVVVLGIVNTITGMIGAKIFASEE